MDFKQRLLAQVHNLKSDCLASHQAFISILHQLQNIVADLALPPDSRQLVSIRASEWEDYCSTYIRIIWRSRYIAENAEASARELVSLLSPCNQGNVPCIEDVHKCLATVKRDKARGQELVDDLSALKSNIDLFSSDWEIVASTVSLKRQSDQDIPERTKKITMALNAIKSKMYQMYNTIQRASAKAACFGSKAIYTMLDDGEEKSVKEEHEPELPSSIEPPQDAFDNIAVPISLICTIWLAISADLGQVAGFIGLTGEAGEHNQIQRRIELLCAEYTFLADIFSQYQLAVANRPPIIRKRKLPSVDSKIPSNTKI